MFDADPEDAVGTRRMWPLQARCTQRVFRHFRDEVARIEGFRPALSQAYLFTSPPGARAGPWHLDYSFEENPEEEIFSLFVQVTAAAEDNCTEFLYLGDQQRRVEALSRAQIGTPVDPEEWQRGAVVVRSTGPAGHAVMSRGDKVFHRRGAAAPDAATRTVLGLFMQRPGAVYSPDGVEGAFYTFSEGDDRDDKFQRVAPGVFEVDNDHGDKLVRNCEATLREDTQTPMPTTTFEAMRDHHIRGDEGTLTQSVRSAKKNPNGDSRQREFSVSRQRANATEFRSASA